MADVFVSYASADRERVKPVVDAIENAGFSVWWDRRIGLGSSFDREIERELDAATCVVVFWSNQSVDSDWVRNEAQEGLERGTLLPICLDETKPPLAFRRVQSGRVSSHPSRDDLDAVISAISSVIRRPSEKIARPNRTNAGATNSKRTIALVMALLAAIGTGYGIYLLVEGGRSSALPKIGVSQPSPLSDTDSFIELSTSFRDDLIRELSTSANSSRFEVTADTGGVDFLVQWSVRESEDEIGLSLNLMEAGGVVIWPTLNTLSISPQGNTSDHLVQYLANMIGLIVPFWNVLDDYTDSLEAKSEFMSGFIQFQSSTQGMGGSERAAVRHFERASNLDPNFIFPIQQLGIIYKNRLGLTLRYEDASKLAHEYAKKGLDLQPNATFLLGTINSFLDLNYAAAIANLEHARKWGHSDGEIEREIGLVHLSKGEIREAIERLKAAEEIGAGTNLAVVHWDLARAYRALGRYETANDYLNQALAKLEGAPVLYRLALRDKIEVAYYAGRSDEAENYMSLALSEHEAENPSMFAASLALLGKTDAATQALALAEKQYLDGELAVYSQVFWGYFFLGETQKALLWLHRAIENREWWLLPMLRTSLLLEPLRAKSEFNAALTRLEEIESQPPRTKSIAFP